MRRRFLFFVAAAIFGAGYSSAAAQSYGTELPFVLGTSARATGMGAAGVSLIGDASVQHYNPAGLSSLQWKQFSFFRATLFDSDASYLAMSYAHPFLNYGTVGVSMLRLSVGGIEQRDTNNQLLSSDLQDSQTRLLFGYSKHITSSIASGFNLKIDNHSFAGFSGTGIGLDVGFSASQRSRAIPHVVGFRQGFAIHNLIEPSVKLDQEDVPDPTLVAFGVSALSLVRHAQLETSIDFVAPRFSPFRVKVGQELRYLDNFSFRLGFDGRTPAYGIGAQYKGINFDYAFTNVDVGGSHRLSIAYRFGPSVTERQAVVRERLETEITNKITTRMNEFEQGQISMSMAMGDSLYAKEQYDAALNQYESTLLWDPGNEHALEFATKCRYHGLIHQAKSAIADDDYAQGTFYAKQALELIPDDPTAQQLISHSNEKIAASQNRAELVQELLKTSIDLYANRQYSEAISGFKEVLNLEPGDRLAEEYRHKCLLHIDESVNTYLRDARNAAGKGDYDTALALLRRAKSLKPDDRRLDAEATRVEQMRRDSLSAEMTPAPIAPVTLKLRSTVNPEILEKKYNRAMSLFNSGEFDDAVALFTEVWSADPHFHEVTNLLTKAYLTIGMRYYSKDNYADAIQVWKQLLTIDPNNTKVKRYLARTTEEYKKLNRDYDN